GTGQRIWTNPFGDFRRAGSVDSVSDVDLFAFNPVVSGSYVISTTQPLDTQLRIYGSSGQPITAVIDQSVGGETTTQNLSQGNWYYIAIAGSSANAGFYTFNIVGPDVPVVNV